MSFRSLLTCVLATAPVAVMASPHGPRDNTVTVTETRTITAAAACSASSSVTTAYNSTTVAPTTSSASNTNPTTTLVATATATNYGLDDAAKAAGKLWFGTAADIPGTRELEDVYYMAQFNNTHDFGEATPANIMKVRHNYPPHRSIPCNDGDKFLTARPFASSSTRSPSRASSTSRAATPSSTSPRPRGSASAATTSSGTTSSRRGSRTAAPPTAPATGPTRRSSPCSRPT